MGLDRYHDLVEGFENKKALGKVLEQFQKATRTAVDDGAEVVIAAGGVVMVLLAFAGVHEAAGNTPILNGVTALIKMGEMAVKLDRIMGGRFTSKRLSFAPPTPSQIAELREIYGPDIYPTVQEE